MSELSLKSKEAIRCAADIIRGCKRGVVLTGAGISTPSGIPDFRSTESGLWERFDPFEVASLSSFRYHPEKFFDWIRPLAEQMHLAQPNPAHIALAQIEERSGIQTIITQNIDRLHQRAGSKNVLEVHGSLETMTCTSCYFTAEAEQFIGPFLSDGVIPRCQRCGSILKPDVVLFGEQLPALTWLKAQKASKQADLMIVAGSSLEVLPVAGLPMRALDNGAHLIIINQSPTYIDVRADVVFHEDVTEILPRIAEAIENE